jgi:hypothetical protein
MSHTFTCGDGTALVTYAYDECEPQERDAITSHLALCGACAEALISLRGTRQALGSWEPPETALGFQISEPVGTPAAGVIPFPTASSKASWWTQPLPAWAQVAAAAVIFAAGLALGLSRGRAETDAPTVAAAGAGDVGSVAVNVPSDTVPAVTQQDLAALEARLRGELVRVRDVAVPARTPARATDDELMQKVNTLIAQSEVRQRREFTDRTMRVIQDFAGQQRYIEDVERQVNQMQYVLGSDATNPARLVTLKSR